MLLFVPVGLGASAIVAICFVPMVFITVVALFIYKQYHQRDTAVAQISKQPIFGDQTAKIKRTNKHESTNRASPSLVLRVVVQVTTKFIKESQQFSLQADY